MRQIITRDLMKARITGLHRQAERDALALDDLFQGVSSSRRRSGIA
jgi:hypothetical protein